MRSRSVLVVEDDPLILAIAVTVFEEARFHVVSFENADDALAHMYEQAANVAVIFTDLQMPGHMDGLVLAEVVGRHWPHVMVLLTSGRVSPMGQLPGNVRFIPKPWQPEDIVSGLRQHVGSGA